MINLLGAATNVSSIIMVAVLGVLLVFMFLTSSRSRKKQQEEYLEMYNKLKAGDKVVTNAGIYGEIVSMKETNMGRVVLLKTGDEEDAKKVSYILVNASVIVGLDNKQDLILDENGEVIDPEETKSLKDEVLKESFKEETKEEPKEEVKEEKVSTAKKTTTKKTTAKKSTSKKTETKQD